MIQLDYTSCGITVGRKRLTFWTTLLSIHAGIDKSAFCSYHLPATKSWECLKINKENSILNWRLRAIENVRESVKIETEFKWSKQNWQTMSWRRLSCLNAPFFVSFCLIYLSFIFLYLSSLGTKPFGTFSMLACCCRVLWSKDVKNRPRHQVAGAV